GNGAQPYAALVQGGDGNFYGTTYRGGLGYNGQQFSDKGTAFKITQGGALTTVYSFSGLDGYGPIAGLVRGRDGNFYGTTESVGANDSGTVFKITPGGALT